MEPDGKVSDEVKDTLKFDYEEKSARLELIKNWIYGDMNGTKRSPDIEDCGDHYNKTVEVGKKGADYFIDWKKLMEDGRLVQAPPLGSYLPTT